MEAPSYPLSQKTSVAWPRISPRRRSNRVRSMSDFDPRRRALGARVDVAGIIRTFVLIIAGLGPRYKEPVTSASKLLRQRISLHQQDSFNLIPIEVLQCSPNSNNNSVAVIACRSPTKTLPSLISSESWAEAPSS
jgi:hypothetical protein